MRLSNGVGKRVCKHQCEATTTIVGRASMADNNQVSVAPELDKAAWLSEIINICIFLPIRKFNLEY